MYLNLFTSCSLPKATYVSLPIFLYLWTWTWEPTPQDATAMRCTSEDLRWYCAGPGVTCWLMVQKSGEVSPPFGSPPGDVKKTLGMSKSLVNNGDKHYQYLPTSTGGEFLLPSISVSHPFFGNFRTWNEDLEENAKVLDNLLKVRTPLYNRLNYTPCVRVDMFSHHF